MDRRDKAAIQGIYSREFCLYCENAQGGFLVEGLGFLTYSEAIKQTGYNVHHWYDRPRVHALARGAR